MSPFDTRICKFEMELWLNACDIDLANHRPLSPAAPKFNQNPLQRAIVRRRTKSKVQNSSFTKAIIFMYTFFEYESVSLLPKRVFCGKIFLTTDWKI